MSKFTAPCAVLLALAATFASVAQAAQPGRCADPFAVQTGDPSLDQLASDAHAVWHELSPEVREMVDELMVSRGLDAPDSARLCTTAALATPDAQPARAQPCKALQTQRNRNNVGAGLSCATLPASRLKAG